MEIQFKLTRNSQLFFYKTKIEEILQYQIVAKKKK